MPDNRDEATLRTPLRLTATVSTVVDLLNRYAAADRELAEAMDRIAGEVYSWRRVSEATVSRLMTLLDDSLIPGVRAKAELDALPLGLRRAGIAAWAQRSVQQATTRLEPRPIGGTA